MSTYNPYTITQCAYTLQYLVYTDYTQYKQTARDHRLTALAHCQA